MAGYISLVGASVAGMLLLSYLTWIYLGYEYIPNIVSIKEAAEMRYDYIVGQFIK